MTRLRQGSEWIVEADLDPALIALDNDHTMSKYGEKLAAIGNAALNLFRYESGDRAYCISPWFSASISIERNKH
jgi:hypothetical protein